MTHSLPEANMRAVARGSRMRIITAAKRRGLNSVLRQRRAIFFRSSRTPRFAIGGWGGVVFVFVGNVRKV